MSYFNTLIQVAEDCPLKESEVPISKNEKKPSHVLEYELLKSNPYTFTHEELIFEVYVRKQGIPTSVLEMEGEKIKRDLFSKGHPCLRASALTKRYGFGAHYNEIGKIALYPMESDGYLALLGDQSIKVIPAMKRKR